MHENMPINRSLSPAQVQLAFDYALAVAGRWRSHRGGDGDANGQQLDADLDVVVRANDSIEHSGRGAPVAMMPRERVRSAKGTFSCWRLASPARFRRFHSTYMEVAERAAAIRSSAWPSAPHAAPGADVRIRGCRAGVLDAGGLRRVPAARVRQLVSGQARVQAQVPQAGGERGAGGLGAGQGRGHRRCSG